MQTFQLNMAVKLMHS